MSDVVERAEAALQDCLYARASGIEPPYPLALVQNLVEELKATRTEVHREHQLFAQEAAATNRRAADAWQSGYAEGRSRR